MNNPCCCCCCMNSQNNNNPNLPFVAAGTGIDPHNFTTLQSDIPFGDGIYNPSGLVAHWANAAEFIIQQDGIYEINYQLSVYNPALDPSLGFNITTNLVSNVSGILDTINFTRQNELVQRRLQIYLRANEIIRLEAIQPELSDISINSQCIIIQKIH